MKSKPHSRPFEPSASTTRTGRAQALRYARRERLSNVLLALTDGDHPSAALEQCSLLAQSLKGDLHILQVLPPESHFAPMVPDLDLVQATRRVERCLTAARAVKAWCDDVLPEPLSAKRLRIRVGNFIQDVASRAAEVDAGLIVLAPSTGRLGATATMLAVAASCPVLVARTSVPEATLLAATDLEDDDYWVLRKAVELGQRLNAPIVAVHNVSCMPVAHSERAGSRGASSDVREPRALRLVRASEQLNSPMETIVSNEVDAVDAILDQARSHDANLIIVGARPRRALARFISRSVAVEVVNRSDRSVLVTPFELPS